MQNIEVGDAASSSSSPSSPRGPSDVEVGVFGDDMESLGTFFFCTFGNEGKGSILDVVEKGDFARDVELESGERMRVALCPFFGYGGECLFEDAGVRRCQVFLYVLNVARMEHVASFRKLRKKVALVKPDAKFMLIAITGDESGVSLAREDIDFRMHECQVMASNYSCLFVEGGWSKKRMHELKQALPMLLQEMVAGRKSLVASSELPEVVVSRTIDLCVVGDMFVGKTSLISSLLAATANSNESGSASSESRGPMSGVAYEHTTAIVENAPTSPFTFLKQHTLRLRVFDTPSVASAEELAAVLSQLSRGVSQMHAFLVVFSLRNQASFKLAPALIHQIQASCGNTRVPIMMVGTNNDQMVMRCVSSRDLQTLSLSLSVPCTEVCCISQDPKMAPARLLAPLLQRVISRDQQLHLQEGSSSPDMLSRGSDASSKQAVVFWTEVVNNSAKKSRTWNKSSAEIKTDTLILTPQASRGRSSSGSVTFSPSSSRNNGQKPSNNDEDDVAAADVSSPRERRRSNIFTQIRRMSVSSTSRSSAASDSPESKGSPAASSNDVRMVSLLDCDVVPGPMNPETGRHPFTITEKGMPTSVVVEVESMAKRDEWVQAIKKASVMIEDRSSNANGSLGGGGTVGRRRGLTLQGVMNKAATLANLFEDVKK